LFINEKFGLKFLKDDTAEVEGYEKS